MITSEHHAKLPCHKLLTVSLLEINGTVSLSLPWLPEAFHARFRPKTCRPAADEAPCRALEKTSGTHTCSLLPRVFFFVSWNTGTPSSRMRIVLRNRNIIRRSMENLSIAIQGFKIEIKIDQNFLPCLLVLFVVRS